MNRSRQRLSQDSILYCRSYALEAERKMGQILAETERAVGTDKAGRSKKLDGNRSLPSNPPPTLDELGLTKRERAKPPGDNQHKKQDRSRHVTEAPTLDELGLTKRESADAQMLAELPQADFDKIKAGTKTRTTRPHSIRSNPNRLCLLNEWRHEN
jgi:hypothetical protein